MDRKWFQTLAACLAIAYGALHFNDGGWQSFAAGSVIGLSISFIIVLWAART